MITTRYKINAPVKIKIALVAYLHGESSDELFRTLEKERPNIIACAGDLATVGE